MDPNAFGLLVELFLRDGQGLKHLFEDVGSGIGYVLPVLCAVFRGGVDLSTCFIQQPELHLHPDLQAAMGDVFIEASGASKQILIETHSEHLLLRILKRIRQTHLQTNIAPELKINADNVCVCSTSTHHLMAQRRSNAYASPKTANSWTAGRVVSLLSVIRSCWMNELFAADPAICSHASELKLLLASFGPYAGRYLANYPIDWAAQVERQFENLGEVEAAKVRTLLQRAKETLTLVTCSNLLWNSEQEWLANAAPLLDAVPRVFDGLVAKQATPPAIHQLDALDLPPTAEERIASNANEYARVAKILLLLSPEIALVDPYLNPLKRSCVSVLKALFELAAKGKSQKISLWARASAVIGHGTYPPSRNLGCIADRLQKRRTLKDQSRRYQRRCHPDS